MRKGVLFRVLALASFLVLVGSIQFFAAQAYAAPQTVTIKGELIDTYCYSTMGAKGPSHRDCAIECVKKGIPAGILEDGTNKVYVLLPNKDKTGSPASVLDKMAQVVSVTGKVYSMGGSQFLTIESIR